MAFELQGTAIPEVLDFPVMSSNVLHVLNYMERGERRGRREERDLLNSYWKDRVLSVYLSMCPCGQYFWAMPLPSVLRTEALPTHLYVPLYSPAHHWYV